MRDEAEEVVAQVEVDESPQGSEGLRGQTGLIEAVALELKGHELLQPCRDFF